MDWNLVVAVVSAVIAGFSLVAALWATSQARAAERRALAKERRVATLELWMAARDDLIGARREARMRMRALPAPYPQDDTIRRYLARVDQIAVGVNVDLYEEDTLLRLTSGREFVEDARIFAPYIDARRAKSGRPTYKEFTDLVARIAQRDELDDG